MSVAHVSYDRPTPEEREPGVFEQLGYSQQVMNLGKETIAPKHKSESPVVELGLAEATEAYDPHPDYVKDFIRLRDEEIARGVGETELEEIGAGLPTMTTLHRTIARSHVKK